MPVLCVCPRRLGTEARIKRTNRRQLLLLSDALLIGEPPVPAPGKKAGPKDQITVKQVMTGDQKGRRARRLSRGAAW